MKHRSMKTVSGLLLTLPGLLLTAPHAAQATDSKVYSGTMCVNNGDNLNHEIRYAAAGQAYNQSDSTIYTVCPIVRDNTVWGWERLDIRVQDNHPSYDFTCYFRIGDGNGGTDYVRTVKSSGTGIQTLTIQNSTSGSIGPLQRTPYSLFCSIPGKYGSKLSGILYYVIDEE